MAVQIIDGKKIFNIDPGMPLEIWCDKYSRKLPEGRFQTWSERITEVVDGNFTLDPRMHKECLAGERPIDTPVWKEFQNTLKYARQGIIAMSGRHLQHGDLDQKNKIMELFTNCSSAMFSFIKFYLLLKGSGVGRCYDSDACWVDWDYMPNCRFVLNSSHPDYKPWIESLEEAEHKYDSEGETTRWFKIKDSAEGWVKMVSIIETAAFHKNNKDHLFIFDLSGIRGEGVPILGQQGRPASGPVPLIQSMMQVMSIKGAGYKPWKQALFIDHYLSDCVRLGGIRRSARLAIKIWTDRDVIDFIDVKRGGWLHTANNSIGVDAEFWRQARDPRPSHARRVYEAAVGAAFWDNTGEPGFINLDKLTWNNKGFDGITADNYINRTYREKFDGIHYKTEEMIKYTLAKIKGKKYPYIPNPCCVPGHVEILTQEGYRRIEDCVDENITIWNGQTWSQVKPFSVGVYDTLNVKFSDGTSLPCTHNHEFIIKPHGDYKNKAVKIKAIDLKINMRLEKFSMPVIESGNDYGSNKEAYSQGFYSGDGNEGYEFSFIYSTKYDCKERLIGSFKNQEAYNRNYWTHGPMKSKSWVPVHGSSMYCLNWFAGLCDSDGTVVRDENGNGLQISSINKNFLSKTRLMLTRLGVQAKIAKGHKKGKRYLPDGRGGEKLYYCKEGYRLCINHTDTYHLIQLGLTFNRLVTHCNPPQRDARQFVKVVAIEEGERCENFCFDEPINHTGTFNGIVTGQSEINFSAAGAYCVVGDACISNADNEDEVLEAVPLMARALVRTNLMDSLYKSEVDRTNRIGVSLIGIHEFAAKIYGYNFYDLLDEQRSAAFWTFLSQLGDTVQKSVDEFCREIGITTPHTYLTLKPAGTVAKAMNVTEAANLPPVPYYNRFVQFKKGTPILQEYIKRGYPVKDISQSEIRRREDGEEYVVNGYKDTVIVGFPTCPPITKILGDRIVCAADVTVEHHYQWLQLLEKYWLKSGQNNQISYTLKYNPKKINFEEFSRMVLRYQPTVRCCAVLPETDTSAYIYTPETRISKEEYEKLTTNIDRLERESVDESQLSCEGGACGLDGNKNMSIADEIAQQAAE